MIAQAVEKPFLVILMVLLVFNLIQRRHLDHGERKRFASLGFAGLALLCYAATIAIIRFSLPDVLLIMPVVITVFVLFKFKKAFFLFRLHCAECGAPLKVTATLFRDDNVCLKCRAPGETTTGNMVAPGDVSEIDWDAWKPDEDAVTCFIMRGGEILLIHKKTGLGAGKINAPGGRIEPGETAVKAAVRECKEEVGITPNMLEKRADLSFEFKDGLSLHCQAFFAYSHTGTAVESDEADPFWCDIDKIPFSEMWEDDAIWIPMALKGECLEGRFIFDGDRMLSKEIRLVDSFD